MPIILKTSREIDQIRRASRAARAIVEELREHLRPGITTQEIDLLAGECMRRADVVSACRNYPSFKPGEGFPGFTCISVNDEVLHGVPGDRQLIDGDVVKLEVPVCLDGFYGSYAATFTVGPASTEAQRLIDATAQALSLAVSLAQPRKRWSEVAREIQRSIESNGYSVVREFVGHGIGRSHMEDPKVPNYLDSNLLRGDWKIRPGMTFTIDPVVIAGDRGVELLEDGWTIATADGSPSAHFRHTVVITEDGAQILSA